MIPNFSRHLGVAFQIVNDLKDWSTDLQNKRIIGQDALAMRPTLLLALALESVSPAEREELISLISGDAKNDRSVQRVARIYESCQVFEKARKLVEKYRQRAEAIADEVEPEKLRELLYFLIDTALADESIEPEIATTKTSSCSMLTTTKAKEQERVDKRFVPEAQRKLAGGGGLAATTGTMQTIPALRQERWIRLGVRPIARLSSLPGREDNDNRSPVVARPLHHQLISTALPAPKNLLDRCLRGVPQ